MRARLDALYKDVSTEKTTTDQVSGKFLKACKIRLVQYHFKATDAEDESDDKSTNLSHDPPILSVCCLKPFSRIIPLILPDVWIH